MKNGVPSSFPYLTVTLLIAAFICLFPPLLNSQGYLKAQVRNTNCEISNHEADRWYFGQNAGMDFRPQNPVADLTNFNMNVMFSPAVVSDSLGNILFYTDGLKVWSRNHSLMAYGDSLHGYPGHTMPVLVIPKPGADNIYFIFTTHSTKQNANDPRTIWGLEYNEVDLSQNNGMGAVTKRNRQLLPPEVSSKITAVRHSNGVDYWVVAHKFNSSEFCSFLVNSNGPDTTGNYVSSSAGIVQSAPGETNNSIGEMKISPDGTRIAQAVYGSSVFELFDFDPATGKITGPGLTSPPVFTEAFGVEFSSDSKFLYGTTTPKDLPGPVFTPPSYLFQFDLNGGAIFTLYDTIAIDTLGSYFGGIQLGTDGRIYVSRSPNGNAALGVIENPKRKGAACNFTRGGMDLLGKRSRYGFPNFMQTYFDLPHFDVEEVCYADTTLFVLQNDSNIDSVLWNFGDPSSGNNTFTSRPNDPVTHIFSGPGSFPVTATEYFNGIPYGPYTETLTVNELPFTTMPDTVYMYPGSPVNLDAGGGFTSYEWSTGESTQVITVRDTAVYYVTLQNERCCLNSDSVVVIYYDIYVPNAFRPGGANPVFKAVPSTEEAVQNFKMYIYNRWGQQIFYSTDINQGWDGKVNGKDAPGDVYVWLIYYDVERENKIERIAYKGNFILLR